ncbi:MAG TPA: hypothetical protein VI306_03560 [Pyrinomonadaceae bacterium]
MKKSKRISAIQQNKDRPSKPAAPPAGSRTVASAGVKVPTYDGLSKTDRMPQLKPETRSRTKATVDPATLKKTRSSSSSLYFEDQTPKRTRAVDNSVAQGEQYIRMRIRVNNGRLSVIDSHLIDGPLRQGAGFPGTNAYEVTLGERLLHAGALPDLGVQRSFPNPEGARQQRGHYITERDIYEFMARVPASEVTSDTIRKIVVRLLRVKEEASLNRLDQAPLGTQLEREIRPIAELVGLPDSVLPEMIEKRGARTPSA